MHDHFERFHAAVGDAYLDAIAKTAGCDPPVGRLSYLDDETLSSIVAKIGLVDGARVLDLGCGRGYLGRWLAARGPRVAYTGLDASASALGAVKRNVPDAVCVHGDLNSAFEGPYEAIFAIESFRTIDDALAARVFGALARGGSLVATIATFDGSQDERVNATRTALSSAGFAIEPISLPPKHGEFVGRLNAAALIEDQPDAWIRESIAGEAMMTLAALRDGAFRYDVFVSRKS